MSVACRSVHTHTHTHSKLDAPWSSVVFQHIKAAQHRAEGNSSQAFDLYVRKDATGGKQPGIEWTDPCGLFVLACVQPACSRLLCFCVWVTCMSWTLAHQPAVCQQPRQYPPHILHLPLPAA